jgi:hypothetical protein
MNITRREALRRCLIVTVGAALIPGCMQEKSKPLMTLKHLDLNGEQQELISELSETIIPRTDTPGAKDTSTHLFVLKMLDDCTAKEDQEKFVKGISAFEKLAKSKFDQPFVKCTQPQKEELLKYLINDKQAPEDAVSFYSSMKKLTVQGYMTSQYYLTNVRVYKLVPGKFYGCLPVTSLDKKGPSI